MNAPQPITFHQNARRVVANPVLRASFRGAMDFLMAKRAAQFPDSAVFEALRLQGEQIRQYSLSRCPTCSNNWKPT